MSLVKTIDVLNAVKAYIAALQLEDESGPLFDHVQLYDTTELDEAFADLLVRKDRVCLIVPFGDSYNNVVKTNTLRCEGEYTIAFLLADKDTRNGQKAVFGNGDNLGTIGLKDRLVEELTGNNFNIKRVALLPIEGDTLEISEDKPKGKQSHTRKGWIHIFKTPSGVLKRTIERGVHITST